MEKKENQRITLTKRLLKEALLRLMEKKTVQQISVSELCQTAGINRSTFYNHYGSPLDLLREMETDMVAELRAIWDAHIADPNWTIHRRAETLFAYIQAHLPLTKPLFRNSDSSMDFARLLLQSPYTQETFQRHLVDAEDEDSQRLLVTFFINGIYSLIRQWVLEDIDKSPKEMADLLCSVGTYCASIL